jgi:predicted RNase H-like HicB family nuclease
MKRKYSLAIEGEPGSYSAYVSELPAILVTGQSLDELTALAAEAIRLYWESVRADLSPTLMLREIEVELLRKQRAYGNRLPWDEMSEGV